RSWARLLQSGFFPSFGRLRQQHGEGASLAGPALHFDLAFVMRDDLARHSEPDARSPDTSRLRFGALDKLLKDLLLFARWNADPAVSYTEGHALFFATKFHPDSETFGRVI